MWLISLAHFFLNTPTWVSAGPGANTVWSYDQITPPVWGVILCPHFTPVTLFTMYPPDQNFSRAHRSCLGLVWLAIFGNPTIYPVPVLGWLVWSRLINKFLLNINILLHLTFSRYEQDLSSRVDMCILLYNQNRRCWWSSRASVIELPLLHALLGMPKSRLLRYLTCPTKFTPFYPKPVVFYS